MMEDLEPWIALRELERLRRAPGSSRRKTVEAQVMETVG
jgi:hypothetical protein